MSRCLLDRMPPQLGRGWASAARTRGWLCALALLHVLAFCPRAAAQARWSGRAQGYAREATTQAELTGPPQAQCISSRAIESQVRAHSQRIAFVHGAARVPQLYVAQEPSAGATVHARLDVTWPDGQRSSRALAADSCSELNAALAFLITLTLDPTAAPSGPALAPTQGSPAAPLRAAQARSPGPERDTGRLLKLEQIELGILAQLVRGPAPGWMLGFGLRLGVAWRGVGPWLPSLQLSAAHAVRADWRGPGGVADFRLDVLRLALCPLGARWGQLRVQACLGTGLGRMQAAGAHSFAPQSHNRLWLDIGAVVNASLDLGRRWQFGVSVAGAVPWRRDSYAFQPEIFYRSSALALVTDLWAAVRFR